MFNIKKIIIIVVVIALAFGVYAYFFVGDTAGNSSGVTKQAVTTSSQSATAGLDGPGKEFVVQLLAIQNIKFNLQLFSDSVFIGLQDWSRELVPQEVGRPNPFAPLVGDSSSQATTGTFSGDIGSSANSSENSSASASTGGTTATSPASKNTTTSTTKPKIVPTR